MVKSSRQYISELFDILLRCKRNFFINTGGSQLSGPWLPWICNTGLNKIFHLSMPSIVVNRLSSGLANKTLALECFQKNSNSIGFAKKINKKDPLPLWENKCQEGVLNFFQNCHPSFYLQNLKENFLNVRCIKMRSKSHF